MVLRTGQRQRKTHGLVESLREARDVGLGENKAWAWVT